MTSETSVAQVLTLTQKVEQEKYICRQQGTLNEEDTSVYNARQCLLRVSLPGLTRISDLPWRSPLTYPAVPRVYHRALRATQLLIVREKKWPAESNSSKGTLSS
jgi:hypothetical protein